MGRFFRVTCISDQMISILDTEFDFSFLFFFDWYVAVEYIIEGRFNIQSQNQSNFLFGVDLDVWIKKSQ